MYEPEQQRSLDEVRGMAIPGMVFLLVVWGLLTIISAQSGENEPVGMATRQFLFAGMGAVVMVVAAGIPFQLHIRARWIYALILLGALVALPFCGVRINGMKGWFSLGNFLIQPSELAKPVFLLLLSVEATKPGKTLRQVAGAMAVLAAAVIIPIWIQPDFGTVMVYVLTLGALLILRGVAWRHAAWCAAAVLAMGLLFVLTNPYAMRRLVGFLCPDADPTGSGWHIRQFQLAIAHGHWFGAKLGQAFWSNAYLPLAYNDSAYATMAETLGFIGTLPVPAFFVLLFYFLMYDAGREDLQAGARFYLAGAALMLAIQALIHISVNVGLLPPTGLTLPFISYGGSSMIGGCLIIGLALSARHAVRTPSCPKLSKRAVPEE